MHDVFHRRRARLTCAVLLVAMAALLSACGDSNAIERELLLSELREAEANHAMLGDAVRARGVAVASLEQRLSAQASGLQAYQDDVKAYMMNHKMAIAAIVTGAGGGAVALDADNEFSDEARTAGGIAGALAVLYAANNFEEVSTVFDQLVQADAHVDRLQEQIAVTKTRLRAETDSLHWGEAELQEAGAEVRRVRCALRALQ